MNRGASSQGPGSAQSLARACLTLQELDFIINYDIKYRMGGAEE